MADKMTTRYECWFPIGYRDDGSVDNVSQWLFKIYDTLEGAKATINFGGCGMVIKEELSNGSISRSNVYQPNPNPNVYNLKKLGITLPVNHNL